MVRTSGATKALLLRMVSVVLLGAASASAHAADLQAFHADSLAGPMRELKKAFEAQRPGVNIVLTSGVSRQLAERILKGETVDVFAPSSPAVIDEDLIGKPIGGGFAAGKTAATWYVVFSANEMVVITAKGNPHKIQKASDLARVRFVRVNGEKDLATGRTVGFLQRATAAERRRGARTEDHRQRTGDARRTGQAGHGSGGDRRGSARQGRRRNRVLLRSGRGAQ